MKRRQLLDICIFRNAFNEMYGSEKGEIIMSGIPTYEELTTGGHKLGEYLN